MSDEINPVVREENNTEETISNMAEMATKIETMAKAESAENGVYTHNFEEPFTYQGRTCEALTFDWKHLTGYDSMAIEDEIIRKGLTLTSHAFSGRFLLGMAARACTERNEKGGRLIGTDAILAMSMVDQIKICSKAQNFLLRMGVL